MNPLGSDNVPAVAGVLLAKWGPKLATKMAAKLGINLVVDSIPIVGQAVALYSIQTLLDDVVVRKYELDVKVEQAWTWPIPAPEPRPAPVPPSR